MACRCATMPPPQRANWPSTSSRPKRRRCSDVMGSEPSDPRVMSRSRRRFLGALGATVLVFAGAARAGTTAGVDGAGRPVALRGPVRVVVPAGGPASILLYTLAPDLLAGWPRANRAEELPFLLPGIGERPELGRLTGRGGTA